MLASRYNTIIPAHDSGFLLFNNRSGALMRISGSVVDYLRGTSPILPSPEVWRHLAEGGFVVASQKGEARFVANRLKQLRYSVTSMRYTIVLTYRCNLACPYCYEQTIPERRLHMSQETARAFVEHAWRKLLAERCTQLGLTLYGGEPLLNLPVATFITSELKRRCKTAGVSFECSLITNGTLLTEERLKPLSHCLSVVQLTLDGGPEAHDSIRKTAGGEGTFDTILQGARLLLSRNIPIIFRLQVTPDNVSSIEDCLRILQDKGYLTHPSVRFYFFPVLDIKKVCSVRSFQCASRAYDPDLLKTLSAITTKFGISFLNKPAPVWESPYCSFVNRGVYIVDPQGLLYKCVAEVGEAKAVVGSILGSLDRLELSKMADRERRFVARSGMNMAQCTECQYLPTCDGGCAYLSALRNGEPDKPSCETQAYVTEMSLGMNAKVPTDAI
jgi:uncharacterized protein